MSSTKKIPVKALVNSKELDALLKPIRNRAANCEVITLPDGNQATYGKRLATDGPQACLDRAALIGVTDKLRGDLNAAVDAIEYIQQKAISLDVLDKCAEVLNAG